MINTIKPFTPSWDAHRGTEGTRLKDEPRQNPAEIIWPELRILKKTVIMNDILFVATTIFTFSWSL